MGTQPRWFPNGQEFAFHIDSHRAGVSGPTGSVAALPDLFENTKLLGGVSVSPEGDRVALYYFGDAPESPVAVFRYPSLSLVEKFSVPGQLWESSHGYAGSPIWAVLNQPQNAIAEIRPDGSEGALRGFIPGASITRRIGSPLGDIIATFRRSVAIHILSPDGTDRVLSSVAETNQFSVGSDGKVIFSQTQPDKSRAIFMFRPESGSTTRLTAGPKDVSPALLPGGARYAYLDSTRGEVRLCGFDQNRDCAALIKNVRLFAFPAFSPSGQSLAFVTARNLLTRLAVVSVSTGKVEDVAPFTGLCRPRWSSETNLLVLQKSPSGVQWVELDVSSKLPTGKREIAKPPGSDGCPATDERTSAVRDVATMNGDLWLSPAH